MGTYKGGIPPYQSKGDSIMSNYVIFTDSACDIVPETLAQWGVRCQPLTVRFDHIDKDFADEIPSTKGAL